MTVTGGETISPGKKGKIRLVMRKIGNKAAISEWNVTWATLPPPATTATKTDMLAASVKASSISNWTIVAQPGYGIEKLTRIVVVLLRFGVVKKCEKEEHCILTSSQSQW